MSELADRFIHFLRPLAEIRRGERFKTMAMFFYFFLTIALLYILKPVRNALLLDELGAKSLRYVYMGEGVFLIFVAAAYVYLSKLIPRRAFFTSTLLFFASNLILFWFLFHQKVPYCSAYFYIWVASFSITSTTQFWILANDIFDPQEAKRLFGLIISGGSAGGILGGVLTSQAIRWLKTEDLLLVAASILVFCAFVLFSFWNSIYHPGQTPATHAVSASEKKEGRKLLMGSSYLIMLAFLVMIAKISSAIVDNQFNGVVELTIAGKEARTAFLAGFMAWLNGFSFLMQLIFTSLFLRFLGVGFSLWILPVGLALFSAGTFFYPLLGAALFLKVFDGSVNYSIQQASKEVLFLPVPSNVRYRVKPIIDMLGFRIAKSLSGVYIFLLAPLLSLSDERLGILILFLIPFWIFLIWKMKQGYSKLLLQHLDQSSLEKKVPEEDVFAELLPSLERGVNVEEAQSWLKSRSPYQRRMGACALLLSEMGQEDRNLVENFLKQTAQAAEKENGKQTNSKKALKKKIIREMTHQKTMMKLLRLYQSGPQGSHGHEAEALQSHIDELLKTFFEDLQRLYPKKAVKNIYRALTQTENVSMRSHALELLINTLEPDLLIHLPGMFEARSENRFSSQEVKKIIRGIEKSDDSWGHFFAWLWTQGDSRQASKQEWASVRKNLFSKIAMNVF